MADGPVVRPAIWCRFMTTNALRALVVVLVFATPATYSSDEKPNAVERTASKAAKGTETVSYTHLTLPTNREV